MRFFSKSYLVCILVTLLCTLLGSILIGVLVHGERFKGWCLHKSYPPIAAGINATCSRIPSHIRPQIANHTNAVEQAHEKSYSMGKKQHLLPAIHRSVNMLVLLLVTLLIGI